MGDRHCRSNPFRWERVQLNLPTMEGYDPQLPWVAKIRGDGSLDSDIFLYVDDVRSTRDTEIDCHQASRQFGSKCNYLGIQDAQQKRKPPDQEQGPWAGSQLHTMNGVEAMLPQEKWEKLKAMVARIEEMRQNDPEAMDRKESESLRGGAYLLCEDVSDTEPIPEEDTLDD